MSAAELTARKVYEEYHIGTLADDVQRHLIILMLSKKAEHDAVDYTQSFSEEQMPPQYAAEDIHTRIAKAEKDIINGNTTLAADMETRMEKNHPWLCK